MKPFTTTDVSRILGCTPRTAAKIIDRGDIACFRLPGGHRRVWRGEMVRFLEAKGIPPDRIELASPKAWQD